MTKDNTLKAADNIRILSMSMVEKANSGHPGGAMGGADFIHILFSEYLNYDPDDAHWFFRDRFFLDPGHMSPMLYAVLSLCGKYTTEDLQSFRQWGSVTPGHPEIDFERGVENGSGPLGQGHAYGLGAAIAERFITARTGDFAQHKTYAYISDGGIQEEISQGVGRLAGHLGLNNFIMFFDSNDVQLSTKTESVTDEDTAKKYESWGWRTMTIDGHNANEIRKALDVARDEKEKPFLIIGKTVMGKGLVTKTGESFEHQVSTHGQPVSKAGADFAKSIENLGGNPENPFEVFTETAEIYAAAMDKKRAYVKEKRSQEAKWRSEHPEQAKQLDEWISGKVKALDFSTISQKENAATRDTSGNALHYFAQHLDNMIVSSADLANSDKTEGFLKASKALTKDDFSGGFLHAGVAELTMAAVACGMTIHGGVIPVTGTFFVFSDYMKPAIRMTALMQQPVKYVFTHDAFRVGEDGPTHQPIEQEAQLRLLEKVKNHAGGRSLMVLRPADSAETKVAWKMALENTQTPTALILSRQGIKDIEPIEKSRYEEALQAEKGAYLVRKSEKAKITLVGNGSEVATLLETADKLEKEHQIYANVVSAISPNIFLDQDKDYQNKVMNKNLPVFGLTAGLPDALRDIVGNNGEIMGLDHFGYSAPYKVLDEKFGFTPEQVSEKVLQLLG